MNGKELTPKELVALREAKDWRQEDLASALRVSFNTVRNWEMGRTAIPLWVAMVLDKSEKARVKK